MRRRSRKTFLLVLLLLCPGLVTAEDGEWGRFRGPNGSGVSDAKNIPVTWGGKNYNWTVRLPGVGYGSPVIWGDRIYVTSGDEETGERRLICLNVSGGETRWQTKYTGATYKQHRDNAYAASTPAADAQGVVMSWATPGEVVMLALDPDGKELWRRELGRYQGLHGGGVSPVIVGDLVVLPNDMMDPKRFPGLASGPPGKSFLIAVDRSTGQTRWKVDRRSSLAAYSIPSLHRFDGGEELIFTGTSHGITAVDPASGKVNWELPDVFPDRCVGSPISDSGLVLAGFGYGMRGTRFVAVRPVRDRNAVLPVIAYDVKKSVPLVPTALAKDGRLYLWSDDGIVTCLELATGEVFWRERVQGRFYGSPVWVDGKLYCIARNGDVVVLAASETFNLLARVSLGEPSNATPAVASGVMYLRTNSGLFSLGGGAQAKKD
jgi:outer membrane protein assembly factor BamB